MTGFGSSLTEENGLKVMVEIKTLNSKNIDFSLRIPKKYQAKEQEIRKFLSDKLERGKIAISVDIQQTSGNEDPVSFNHELIKKYYNELSSLADSLATPKDDILKTVLHLPNVIESAEQEGISDEEWSIALNAIQESAEACNSFRETEGKVLEGKLISYVETIESTLKKIAEKDPERLANLKQRLQKAIDEKVLKADVDQNRFEQELIYYIEKLDIEEEKARLTSHINFFYETLQSKKAGVGKKLGFISQEMGREINTIGSKANNATIQHLVVEMKEELEKIKEQTLNIL